MNTVAPGLARRGPPLRKPQGFHRPPPWRGRIHTATLPRGCCPRLRAPERETQAADAGIGPIRVRARATDWPFKETGWSLKEFFPTGIIARGIGSRSGLLWRCFDSSHAQSRGS